MKEKNLFIFCFTGIIIGLVLLYVISNNLGFPGVNIDEISEKDIGSIVNVTGTIEDLTFSEGNLFFNIRDDSGRIKALVWNDTLEYLELNGFDTKKFKESREINTLAYVELYRGELELIPLREYVHVI